MNNNIVINEQIINKLLLNYKNNYIKTEEDLINDNIKKSNILHRVTLYNINNIKKLINDIENFIINNDLLCYGGSAINMILPENDKIYNYEVDTPDYDVYSNNSYEKAKHFANYLYKNGYNVEVKHSSVHKDVFKIYINNKNLIDVTQIERNLFNELKKYMVVLNNGIKIIPINYLRMNMYVELSKPLSDTSRWLKISSRLALLNKYYSIKSEHCEKDIIYNDIDNKQYVKLYNLLVNLFVKHKSVFIGDFSMSFYYNYMSKHHVDILKKYKKKIEIISENPEKYINKINIMVNKSNINNVTITKEEIYNKHFSYSYKIDVKNETICMIFIPSSCFNYNVILKDNKEYRIATIFTMMTHLLSCIYTGKSFYNNNYLYCCAQYLFIIYMKKKNRMEQTGILNNYSLMCIGKEKTIVDMIEERNKLYEKLKKDRNSYEFKKYFLKYNPGINNETKKMKNKNIKDKNKKTNKNKQ